MGQGTSAALGGNDAGNVAPPDTDTKDEAVVGGRDSLVDSEETVVKEGWLAKEGRRSLEWKPMFFSLRKTVLYANKMLEKANLGLNNAHAYVFGAVTDTSSHKGKYRFSLITRESREPLNMMVDTEEEMLLWVSHLEAAIGVEKKKQSKRETHDDEISERDAEFHKTFRLSGDELLLEVFPCSWDNGKKTRTGELFVSTNYVCFKSDGAGTSSSKKVIIRMLDITKLEKRSAALGIYQNILDVLVDEEKYSFTGLHTRDETHHMINYQMQKLKAEKMAEDEERGPTAVGKDKWMSGGKNSPEYQGWVLLESGSSKGWHRRFITLKEERVRVFEMSFKLMLPLRNCVVHESKHRPAKSEAAPSVTGVVPTSHRFFVSNAEHILNLSAETEEEMKGWVKSIYRAIQETNIEREQQESLTADTNDDSTEAETRAAGTVYMAFGMSRNEREKCLKDFFGGADPQNTGKVSRSQFRQCLRESGGGSQKMLRRMNAIMAQVEEDENGLVEYCRFLPIVFELLAESVATDVKTHQRNIKRWEAYLIGLFKSEDSSKRGCIPLSKVASVLTSGGIGLTKEERDRVLKFVDKDNTGMVWYTMAASRIGTKIMCERISGKLSSAQRRTVAANMDLAYKVDRLRESNIRLLMENECQLLDIEFSGFLSKTDFTTALDNFLSELPVDLPDNVVAQLRGVAFDENGSIFYDEYVRYGEFINILGEEIHRMAEQEHQGFFDTQVEATYEVQQSARRRDAKVVAKEARLNIGSGDDDDDDSDEDSDDALEKMKAAARKSRGLERVSKASKSQEPVSDEMGITKGLDDFWAAAKQGDYDTVLDAVKRGLNVNVQNDLGRTILHLVVMAGDDHQVAAKLLRFGAQMNVHDKYGYSPLHYAAAKERMKVLTLLLDRGCNINIRSTVDGCAPLHLAAFRGNMKVCRLLVMSRADLFLENMKNLNPMEWAATAKPVNVEIVRMLKRAMDAAKKKKEDGGEGEDSTFNSWRREYTDNTESTSMRDKSQSNRDRPAVPALKAVREAFANRNKRHQYRNRAGNENSSSESEHSQGGEGGDEQKQVSSDEEWRRTGPWSHLKKAKQSPKPSAIDAIVHRRPESKKKYRFVEDDDEDGQSEESADEPVAKKKNTKDEAANALTRKEEERARQKRSRKEARKREKEMERERKEQLERLKRDQRRRKMTEKKKKYYASKEGGGETRNVVVSETDSSEETEDDEEVSSAEESGTESASASASGSDMARGRGRAKKEEKKADPLQALQNSLMTPKPQRKKKKYRPPDDSWSDTEEDQHQWSGVSSNDVSDDEPEQPPPAGVLGWIKSKLPGQGSSAADASASPTKGAPKQGISKYVPFIGAAKKEPLAQTQAEVSARKGQRFTTEQNRQYVKMLGLPKNEEVIEVWACAWAKPYAVQGWLYVCRNHLAFHSKIITENKLVVAYKDIDSIEKKNAAYIIPSAIEITTHRQKYFFINFISRSETFELLEYLTSKAKDMRAFFVGMNARRGRGGLPEPTSDEEKEEDADNYLEKALIRRGASFDITFNVKRAGAVIGWAFSIDEKDVGFGLGYVSHDREIELDIFPIRRVHASLGVVTGKHETEYPGVYILTWDNSYSYLASKVLRYRTYVDSGEAKVQKLKQYLDSKPKKPDSKFLAQDSDSDADNPLRMKLSANEEAAKRENEEKKQRRRQVKEEIKSMWEASGGKREEGKKDKKKKKKALPEFESESEGEAAYRRRGKKYAEDSSDDDGIFSRRKAGNGGDGESDYDSDGAASVKSTFSVRSTASSIYNKAKALITRSRPTSPTQQLSDDDGPFVTKDGKSLGGMTRSKSASDLAAWGKSAKDVAAVASVTTLNTMANAGAAVSGRAGALISGGWNMMPDRDAVKKMVPKIPPVPMMPPLPSLFSGFRSEPNSDDSFSTDDSGPYTYHRGKHGHSHGHGEKKRHKFFAKVDNDYKSHGSDSDDYE